MTEAQKKAEELTGKFYDLFSDELENIIAWSEAQACAKLCVDEIMKTQKAWGVNPFWQEVKSHLNVH